MLLNCGVGEDSWESPGLQGDQTNQSERKSVLNIHWKDWCWRWNSNTLATWCKELTHWKRPWCWKRLKAGKGTIEDEMIGSPTQWTWVWVNSGSWWWTGRPGELQSMVSQRVGHDWVTELNWFIYYSILAGKIPWRVDPRQLQFMELQSWTQLSDRTELNWEPCGKAVLLGSLTLLFFTYVPLSNKVSCFVSTCISSSPQTIHFWVLDKSCL